LGHPQAITIQQHRSSVRAFSRYDTSAGARLERPGHPASSRRKFEPLTAVTAATMKAELQSCTLSVAADDAAKTMRANYHDPSQHHCRHGHPRVLTTATRSIRPVGMVQIIRSSCKIGGLALLSVLMLVLPWREYAQAAVRAAPPTEQDALGRAAEWITSGLEAAGIAVIVLACWPRR
jgi:hypothetical protein